MLKPIFFILCQLPKLIKTFHLTLITDFLKKNKNIKNTRTFVEQQQAQHNIHRSQNHFIKKKN